MTLATAIVALIVALVFWQNRIFLYCLAAPVSIVYGLKLANDNDNGSSLWVSGIAVAVIGTYCIFKVAIMAIEEYKKRNE